MCAHMTVTEEILRHITHGRRVLVRALDQQNRMQMIRRLYGLKWQFPSLEFRRDANRVVDEDSGGYAHFVVREEEVMGMEYHAGIGYLTETMRSRVRL